MYGQDPEIYEKLCKYKKKFSEKSNSTRRFGGETYILLKILVSSPKANFFYFIVAIIRIFGAFWHSEIW